ncbi:MAG: hypothetical protein ABIQ11_11945 [Saprospiraceae bacterium]
MAQTTGLNHLESLIRSIFEEGRCGEYYMVDLELSPSKKIVVFIDGDEGVSLGTCTQISRVIESVLDEEPTLGGVYELEVSSPGVSRPLRFPRQYLKHTVRTLRIEMMDGTKIEGLLKNTGHDSISVDVKSADKKNQSENREIPFDQIKEAYVTVQFGKK